MSMYFNSECSNILVRGEQDSPWRGAAWIGEHPSEPEQGGEAWEECVSGQASDKAEDEVIKSVIVIWKIINSRYNEYRRIQML